MFHRPSLYYFLLSYYKFVVLPFRDCPPFQKLIMLDNLMISDNLMIHTTKDEMNAFNKGILFLANIYLIVSMSNTGASPDFELKWI